MGLSRLAKKCRECPHVDECQCKRMEAVAYITGVDLSSEHQNELASGSVIDFSTGKNIISVAIQPIGNVELKNIVDKLTKDIYSSLCINSELFNNRR